MHKHKNRRSVSFALLAFFVISGLVACRFTYESSGGDGTVREMDEIHEEIVATREASQNDELTKDGVDNSLIEPEDLPAEGDERPEDSAEEATAPGEANQTTDGDTPAAGSEAAPATADGRVEEAPGGASASIAPGTYRGAFDFLEIIWIVDDDFQGTIAENEVVLVVSDSGAISGEMNYVTEGFGQRMQNTQDCIAYSNWEYRGSLSGRAENPGGSIDASLHKKIIYGQSDACSFDQSRVSESDIIVVFNLESTDGGVSGVSLAGADGRASGWATFTVRK